MDARLRNAYTFHKQNGGWIVGRRAEGALESARAELVLSDAVALGVATVEWMDDPEPWDEGTEISAEEARAKFESNEWTGPYGCVITCGDASASLWGIVVGQAGTNDPYCRVVAAELAGEIVDDLRQAVGDARDEYDPAGILVDYVESTRHALTWPDVIHAKKRLEELRAELRAERISYSELAELQGLASFIDPADVELLEAAGVPEFSDNA